MTERTDVTDDKAKQPAKKISLPEEEKGPMFVKTLEHTVRFSALANAGGALATATVIGATAKEGEILNILAVPLGLFAGGVVCALLTAASSIFVVSKMATGKLMSMPPPFEWVGPFLYKFGNATLVGTVACFILGCVTGVMVIAFA